MPETVGCAPTGPGLGSTCAAATTFSAIVPGFILDGYRQNIQIGQVTVQDGGSDGNAASGGTGDATYAESGIFAP
jgi:hypothetical protein